MNLITVKEASLHYKGLGRPALNRINLSVVAGVTVGIVGESGSGKSSLARCIMGLEVLSSGTVEYKGTDIAELPQSSMKAYRRAVQMVFQDPYHSLNPRMTIGDAISEVLLVHQLAAGRADARGKVQGLLDRVGLGISIASRYPHELSGGQRQRVGIARALALSPEVVIADEPVSALDVSVQAHILNLLKTLVRETGVTLVLIAHDLAVVRSVCDRVAVMHEGHVVEEGITADVIDRPTADYTRRLIASVPEL